MNPSGKVQLVFANVHRNLHVPFMSKNLEMIFLHGIRRLMNTLLDFFYFVQIFLAFDGVVLLFHLDGLRVLKEFKSYLKRYGFQI
jgi:hypothetical protein